MNGIRLLKNIFHEAPERRRECLYYLAIAEFKIKNYEEANEYVELLLQLEPSNNQAQKLKKRIDNRVLKDGYIGLSIIGGVILSFSLLSTFTIRKLK